MKHTDAINVLILGYNRPYHLSKVLDAVRAVANTRIYIAFDGPKSEQDKAACEETKAVTYLGDQSQIMARLERDENLGCSFAVTSAIDWFFSQVADGIILEDDCVPSEDFFPFANILLKKYENDDRIGLISGSNEGLSSRFFTSSYTFSRFGGIWGWATWKRAWKHYSFHINDWNEQKKHIYHLVPEDYKLVFRDIFEPFSIRPRKTVWDIPWLYARLTQGMLAVVPHRNVISNIGWGEGATHTKEIDDNRANLQYQKMTFPLSHPWFVRENPKVSRALIEIMFGHLKTSNN